MTFIFEGKTSHLTNMLLLFLEQDLAITGGVAKNAGIVSRIERELGIQSLPAVKGDPQIAGAVGAAVFAAEIVAQGSVYQPAN